MSNMAVVAQSWRFSRNRIVNYYEWAMLLYCLFIAVSMLIFVKDSQCWTISTVLLLLFFIYFADGLRD